VCLLVYGLLLLQLARESLHYHLRTPQLMCACWFMICFVRKFVVLVLLATPADIDVLFANQVIFLSVAQTRWLMRSRGCSSPGKLLIQLKTKSIIVFLLTKYSFRVVHNKLHSCQSSVFFPVIYLWHSSLLI
jgi:hypothetical protein